MLHESPAALLARLIQFDTTNPPGNETACVAFVADLCRAAGLDPIVVGRDPGRANLVVRLPGEGRAAPLVLNGHVDVVTTAGQAWARDPFGGEIVDGEVWGRGALDMKGAVAAMTAAVLQMAHEGVRPPGDVILTLVADEEAGGSWGAGCLVEDHPHLFDGVRYAITEALAMRWPIGGKRLYPVIRGEKQPCHLTLTFRGPAGHAARGVMGDSMRQLATALLALDTSLLPIHVLPIVRQMVETLASVSDDPATVRDLLDPARSDAARAAIGPLAELVRPVLRNTANPTIVRGGHKINVVPAEVTLEIDGRVLPGLGPDDLIRDLRAVIGDDVEIQIGPFTPFRAVEDDGFQPVIDRVLADLDPAGVAWPFMTGGATDARHFARLGIATYGFMPNGMDATSGSGLVHAADERIPVSAVEFSTRAFRRLLVDFG